MTPRQIEEFCAIMAQVVNDNLSGQEPIKSELPKVVYENGRLLAVSGRPEDQRLIDDLKKRLALK